MFSRLSITNPESFNGERMKIKLNTVYIICLYILMIMVIDFELIQLNINWQNYWFYIITITSLMGATSFYWISKYIHKTKPILLKECNECGFLVPLHNNKHDVLTHCCRKDDKKIIGIGGK